MKNEILNEVWRNRDEFAKRCKYDLDTMVKKLRKIEHDPRNPLAVRPKRKSSSRRATKSHS
jgi:hypothetical protein